MDRNLQEELLEAWLQMSMVVSNKRLTDKMSFNEAMICHILYYNEKSAEPKNINATELCRQTKMLKSLMNGTLNRLEKKGMIVRSRSQKDKRQIYIHLNPESLAQFEEEHKSSLKIVEGIIESVGKEKIEEAIVIFQSITEHMKTLSKKESEN